MLFEEKFSKSPNTSISILQKEAQKVVDTLYDYYKWGEEFEIDSELNLPKQIIEAVTNGNVELIVKLHNYCCVKNSVSKEMQERLKNYLNEDNFPIEHYENNFGDPLFSFENISKLENFFSIPSKIEISNDPCTYINPHSYEGIFDLLGVYQKDGDNAEGKIILYKICIEEFAKDFYVKNACFPNLKLTSEADCADMLYKIIFWHEMGHWITHWMLDTDEFRWDDRFWSLVPNPNDLLEGLAQAITYYFIINDADCTRLKFMFEYLLLGQSAPYHKHIDIIKHPNFGWKNFFKALEQIRQEDTQDLATYLSLLGKL